MTDRPRLLFLSHLLPYPPDSGAKSRTYHLLRALADNFEITALCFQRGNGGDRVAAASEATSALARYASVSVFPIRQETSRLRWIADHLESIFSPVPYTRGTYRDASFGEAVRAALRSGVDLVHVDSIDLAGHLNLLGDTPFVCGHHNIESQLLERRAAMAREPVACYIRHQAARVRAAEGTWCRKAALNVVVSDQDASLVTSAVPSSITAVVPNGVDTERWRSMNGVTMKSDECTFLGASDWFPNLDGMDFFATEVLPLIRKRRPSIHVRWIGRVTSDERRRFSRFGVECLGHVASVPDALATTACCIAPLRIGGGTRLKILESWALEKAIVSTTLGAEGLSVEPGINLLLGDSAEAFADAVLRVLEDDALRNRLAFNGRRTAEQQYNWSRLGQDLCNRYLGLRNSTSGKHISSSDVRA